MKRILFLVLLAVSLSGCSAIQSAFTVDNAAQAQGLTPTAQTVTPLPPTLGPTTTLGPTPTLSQVEVLSTEVARLSAQLSGTPATTPQPGKVAGAASVDGTRTTATMKVINFEMTGELFLSPVEVDKYVNDASKWLIGEPGVTLDDTATFTRGQIDAPYYVNIPEGGFTYFSLGEGKITLDGVTLTLKGEKGLNYLVVVRGRIDDNIVDSDLNETAVVSDFVPGHTIWSEMPTGARVSMGWFVQQLEASTTKSFSNCGATGCSRVKIVFFDVGSHLGQVYLVQAGYLTDWHLLESNNAVG